MPEQVVVRDLRATDLTDAVQLSQLAGWNQTTADWRRLLLLAPDACFCIEQDDKVVASTTLVTYNRNCAWLGMVLSHPDWRGRGFARRLVEHTLALARSRGVLCVKLDATAQGQHLYESFGFQTEQVIERWERPGMNSFAESPQSYCAELDQAAYGYSRAELLSSLGVASGAVKSFALTRPGAVRPYLGPCVAENSRAARDSIAPIVETDAATGWYWDLLPQNHDAVQLACSLGFNPVRSLVRMSLGSTLRKQEEKIFALAGLEFG
jgi:GNAT superfamily N-acetyltransferase